MRRAAFFIPLFLTTAASGTVQTLTPVATTSQAPVYQPGLSSAVGYAIDDWRRLRQSDGYAFADYARFLNANPGWPGETSMRRAAEKQMRPGEHAATVIEFFRATPPSSGNGYARLADALALSGRSAEASRAARDALSAPALSSADEAALTARYWTGLTTADHDRRLDRLLVDRKPADAQRLLGYGSVARRGAFQARIAMQTNAPDAESRFGAVVAQVDKDGGLMMDRARYLRDTGRENYAWQLLARPHSFADRPVDTERWFELMLLLARSAHSARQPTLAYNIARQVDDALPAGVNLSLQSYGVRDDYTSLTWLAGTLAMRSLNRAADAAAQFDRYSRGGRSLQVVSKGAYWAGRAASQAGRFQEATQHFQRAAAYPELFYGQLALERLGRAVPSPVAMPQTLLTGAQRQAFGNKRLVQAVRALGQQGRRDEQALFVRALSEALDSEDDRVMATELSNQLGRQDLAVWTARSARNDGQAFYYRQAFPTVAGGIADQSLWSISHGITRQESSFDRTAISGAGARGMMQLMLPTAREQADKMGVSYDWTRLTSDPSYNVMLGSAYFGRLLAQWDGNYPLAVASYNAGAGNVRKWVRNNGDPRRQGADIVSWIEDIPFQETRGYVQRVLENSVVYDRLNPRPATQPRQLSYFLGKPRAG